MGSWFYDLDDAGSSLDAREHGRALRELEEARSLVEQKLRQVHFAELFLLWQVLDTWSLRDVKKAMGRGGLVLRRMSCGSATWDVLVRGQLVGCVVGVPGHYEGMYTTTLGEFRSFDGEFATKALAVAKVCKLRAEALRDYSRTRVVE